MAAYLVLFIVLATGLVGCAEEREDYRLEKTIAVALAQKFQQTSTVSLSKHKLSILQPSTVFANLPPQALKSYEEGVARVAIGAVPAGTDIDTVHIILKGTSPAGAPLEHSEAWTKATIQRMTGEIPTVQRAP